MASTNGSKSSTKSPKATKAAKATKAKAPTAAEKNQARAIAETAVDIPVGAVLSLTDRVTDLVEPFTGRSSAEKKIQGYRGQLRRTVKRTERRGATARRKATTEARKTRNRVEREARKRQRTVETTLKRNRTDVEKRVRKAIEEQGNRAQGLVDQVSEQLSSLR